jgi:hypothetical protein
MHSYLSSNIEYYPTVQFVDIHIDRGLNPVAFAVERLKIWLD